ncbi:MAG: FadR/GntR family transcriptional regulator [Acidimicrobiia bacterium]
MPPPSSQTAKSASKQPAPDPLRVPKIAELIASDMRHKILSGEYAVGHSIREAELIEEYQISRPTMREALRLLEQEQLLTIRRGSHRGARVRLPDASLAVRSVTTLLHMRGATLADIYQARSIFEPPAARLAAENASVEEIDALRATLDEELAAIDMEESAFPLVAWRFHTQLVELSGNATLAVVAGALEQISQRHAQRVVATWTDHEDWKRNAERAHRKLVDLIAAGDGKRAEQYWRTHMQQAGEQLLAHYGEQGIIEVID